MDCQLFIQDKNFPYNLSVVKKVLNQAAKQLKLANNLQVGVVIISGQKIRALNKKYRHKDKVTDVLSFSQKDSPAFIAPPEFNKYLGEIVICFSQIKRQAKRFRQTAKKEFSLILIHGLLHLLGYNDEKKRDYQRMEKIQNQILEKI